METFCMSAIRLLASPNPVPMNYETLLANAPAQDSPEFIEYLRENNVVVAENEHWLLIENAKYHNRRRAWFTLFCKERAFVHFDGLFVSIVDPYWEWEWRKKAASKQTVPGRFHIHLIQYP